jgi:hypothetical protein
LRFDAGANVMLKFENIVCRIVFLGLFFCASLFAAPMENARGTLFILLDGMAPKSEGLFNNYCLDYERSETWGKTGVAKYFQEYVANSKANIYSRSYWNPVASPSEMV